MKRIVFIVATVLLCACRSTVELAETLTAEQIIQKGQDAAARGKYALAAECYETVIARYGMDTNIYIEARYELGHLALKRKNYQTAYDSFNEILSLYAMADAGVISPAFKKLADIGMAKIPPEKLALPEDGSSDESAIGTDTAPVAADE
ncbi:MAG: hypothetical protein IJ191_01745 [Treponema sp.]|nr:hypothetical protein [Treponema sp.]